MRSRACVAVRAAAPVALALLLSPGSPRAAGSAGQASAQGAAEVTVGSRIGEGGGGVLIPVSLATSGDVKIGSLDVEISFPTKMLAHKNTVSGADAAAAGVSVTAEETSAGGETTLRLTFAFPPDSATGKMPDGVLAEVLFAVAREVESGSDVVLKSKVTAWSAGKGKSQVAAVTATNGAVKVTGVKEIPVFGCLFYMH